ncbi:MAG: metalloregulator ArsR/SmtB family transcription factor [Planctomycetota bacterium]
MNSKIKAKYAARSRIIKALSHPTRLFIVDELSKGERCVRKLTAMVGDDISTISKHLSILKNAGIVTDEKRGTQVFYMLRVPCALNFFSCVESVIRTNAKEQAALVKW